MVKTRIAWILHCRHARWLLLAILLLRCIQATLTQRGLFHQALLLLHLIELALVLLRQGHGLVVQTHAILLNDVQR